MVSWAVSRGRDARLERRTVVTARRGKVEMADVRHITRVLLTGLIYPGNNHFNPEEFPDEFAVRPRLYRFQWRSPDCRRRSARGRPRGKTDARPAQGRLGADFRWCYEQRGRSGFSRQH